MAKNKQKISIDDLPNELLSRILGKISLKHDLDNVQLVSRRWYLVVDETIGREIAITSLTTSDDGPAECSSFLPVPSEYLRCSGFKMISKLGVKTCIVDLIRCVNDDRKDANEKEQGEECENRTRISEVASFKYPHLLKDLYLSGSIRSDLFHSLTAGTENLTTFHLNLLAVSQLTPSDLKDLHLPQLKILCVAKCLKAHGLLFDDILSLPNLQILLEDNKFPNMRQIDLRFPIRTFRDFRTIKALLKFLTVHYLLQELYVMTDFPVQVNMLPDFQEDLEEVILFARSLKCDHLKICDVQGIRLRGSYPQLQVWQAVMEQQRALRSLTLRLGHLASLFLRHICTSNKNSLEHLFLYKLNECMDNPIRQNIVLDCAVFSSAQRLQTIYALGCDMVFNVKSLPASLSTLFLSGGISSPEARYILLELPCLQFVSLKNACIEPRSDYGVSLDILREFIAARKVKRLILNGSSLKEDYPNEGLNNGDPENPVQLMKFDNWDADYMYLDWELGKGDRCYYVDKCY